jgi:hypothetical protein
MIVVPATFHQRPQVLCERWMGWQFWAFVMHYGVCSSLIGSTTEWNDTGEHLEGYEAA